MTFEEYNCGTVERDNARPPLTTIACEEAPMAAKDSTTKTCKQCGDCLPIDQFQLRLGKYRDPRCLPCSRLRGQMLRAKLRATREVLTDGSKACRVCGEVKPFSAFPINKMMADTRQNHCKACDNARQREWRKKAVATRPDFVAARKLSQDKIQAKRYGLTLEQYRMLEEMATGKCEICQKPARGRGQWRADSRLHIDHDHKSGRVRGMLCTDCNRGIGLFRDDPKILKRAADYICQRS